MNNNIVEKINKLHEENKHEEIIKLLEDDNITLDYELTCLLARAYNNMNLYNNDSEYIEKGMQLLLSVKELGENDPLWHYRIGYGYFYTDREEDALKHFNRAVELIPKTKEQAALWREFNLGYLISECEAAIKSKEITTSFGTGENATEQDILDFILFTLLHRIYPVDDIVTDNSIYIPEWLLVIKPTILSYSNDRIDIEWSISCPVFDNGIIEESFGAGNTLQDAVYMAVGVFSASLLQTVLNTLTAQNKLEYSSTFNNNIHKWDVYYNTPFLSSDKSINTTIDDLYFWDIIYDEVKKFIGNQKMVCVKIYAAKLAGNLITECRIDDIFINELSGIIGEYIDEHIDTDAQFFTIKQYFILIQHEETTLPYIYAESDGYVQLKNNLKTICNIIHPYDLDQDEDSFYDLIDMLNDSVDDFTLCIESLIFIPEIFASNVYDNIDFPEHMMVSFNEETPVAINFTQFADYSRIYRAIWEIFDSYEDITKRDELYNKFINMSITINGIMMNGKELDEDSENIIVPVFELNADERFEIR